MSKAKRQRIARGADWSTAGQAPHAVDGNALWPSQNGGSAPGGMDEDMELDFSGPYIPSVPVLSAELYAPAYQPPLPESEQDGFRYSPHLSPLDRHYTACTPPLPDTEEDLPAYIPLEDN